MITVSTSPTVTHTWSSSINVTPTTTILPPLVKKPKPKDLNHQCLYPHHSYRTSDLQIIQSLNKMSLYFQPRAPRGPTSPSRALEAAMTPTLMTTGPCPLCSQAGGGRAVTRGEGTGLGRDTFRQVRLININIYRWRYYDLTRLRNQYIWRLETMNSLPECEQECINKRQFKCLSFNFI